MEKLAFGSSPPQSYLKVQVIEEFVLVTGWGERRRSGASLRLSPTCNWEIPLYTYLRKDQCSGDAGEELRSAPPLPEHCPFLSTYISGWLVWGGKEEGSERSSSFLLPTPANHDRITSPYREVGFGGRARPSSRPPTNFCVRTSTSYTSGWWWWWRRSFSLRFSATTPYQLVASITSKYMFT